ncbi:hypothetical protein [Myxococcus sp. RHSTA-1-4]|uniref:hypothetical protein n=1 Tax=Myxococcus sp. RHSTA-1-4 TaxID=2874601 RepID=UPI001CBC7321|nr:hypothetical protein [Myxococcus sp. RHSTA-1-4]MBZ4416391.1 hypothetical protein [Myxococcus sp. RHSTA-1-4]
MVSPRTAPIRTGNTSTFTSKQRRLHIVLMDSREAPYLLDTGRGAPGGARTRAEVSAFQRHHGRSETGQLADVQRERIRQHDA